MNGKPGKGPVQISPGPLVVSLHVDVRTQLVWNTLRRRHFPPDRLVVDAHVTLFHAIAPEHEASVLDTVTEAVARPAFPLRSGPWRPLGRGVALAIDSPELDTLHAYLRHRWLPWLTRQDSQPFHPHVTIQNKVDPTTARATLATLEASPTPRDAHALGISVWHYAGGPWQHVRTALFHDQTTSAPI